ncbi:hypothetical protein SLS60_004889 [Paraconiothyrium brasiliense]|uniref:Uncharacterized protein n=1 Tax=Paraconiothyrium brasiliense TaxID=300254 RepID=A0ABR3RLM4_9PLEO
MARSSRSSRATFGRGGYDITHHPVPGPAPINAGRDPVNKPTPPAPPKGTQPPPSKQEEKQQDPPQGDKPSSNDSAESMPDSPSKGE